MKQEEHTLRPYQEDFKNLFFDMLDGGKYVRGLGELPTGTGKTACATSISREILARESRRPRGSIRRPVLFLTNRNKLVKQALRDFHRDLPGKFIGVEQGESHARPIDDVIIASVASICRENSKRLPWVAENGPSLIVVDEVHHAAADGYCRIVDRYAKADTPILGITATNYRLDAKELVGESGRCIAETVFYGGQKNHLNLTNAIRQGWLSKLRPFRVVTECDISGVGKVGNDLNQGQLSKAVDNTVRTAKVYDRWKELCPERKTVLFCVDITHAVHTMQYWKAKGHSCGIVHSKLPDNEVEEVFHKFEKGDLQCLVNVGICTEGWDCPAVSCIVLLRPTMSWGLLCQMVGRGTRLFTGKSDCIVIDVSDLFGKHNIVQCPTLIGLDADIDLEGVSLDEAEDAVDKASKQGRKRVKKPKSLRDIVTAMIEVDLFAETELPKEVKRFSEYVWMKTRDGYELSLGSRPPTTAFPRGRRIMAELFKDSLGHWRVSIDGNRPIYNSFGSADLPNFQQVDRVVKFQFVGQEERARKDATWRGRGIDDRQVRILKQWGVPIEDMKDLSAGRADLLIKKIESGWRMPK